MYRDSRLVIDEVGVEDVGLKTVNKEVILVMERKAGMGKKSSELKRMCVVGRAHLLERASRRYPCSGSPPLSNWPQGLAEGKGVAEKNQSVSGGTDYRFASQKARKEIWTG